MSPQQKKAWSDRFIPLAAGASGSDRRCYNYYDMEMGKFVFDDFYFDVNFNDTQNTFSVIRYKGAKQETYDLDGNRMEDNKSIDYPSDKYRKANICGLKCYIVMTYGHLILFGDYDYDKGEFVDEIIDFSDLWTFYTDTMFGSYSNNPRISYGGSNQGVFVTRGADSLYKIDGYHMIYYTDYATGDLMSMDTNTRKKKTLIKCESGKKIGLGAFHIIDPKNDRLFVTYRFVTSYGYYGKTDTLIDDNGNHVHEPTYFCTLRSDAGKNGFFEEHPNGDTSANKTRFLKYDNGKIEYVDIGITPSAIDTIIYDLYMIEEGTNKIHYFDDNMKDVTPKDVEDMMVGDRGERIMLSRNKKTGDIIVRPCIGSKIEYPLKLNGETFVPSNIRVINSGGRNYYSTGSFIAFIASRIVDGAVKKTLFMTNGAGESSSETPGEFVTLGEFDEIDAWHDDRWYNKEFKTKSKSDMTKNYIMTTNDGVVKFFGTALNERGGIRFTKKKPMEKPVSR